MAVIKWEPFNELATLRRQMEHLMDTYCRREGPGIYPDRWSPPVDLAESEGEILVKMDIPGIQEEDLSVTLAGHNLLIKGQRKPGPRKEGWRYHRIERTWGVFERLVALPATVDPENIEANYDQGVLVVRLPKKARTAREIPIRSA
jgi:HSP20 family protein